MSNVKVHFSSSVDSLVSHASRNIFTGSLARSIQELWPIIAFLVKKVTGAGQRGFDPYLQRALALFSGET